MLAKIARRSIGRRILFILAMTAGGAVPAAAAPAGNGKITNACPAGSLKRSDGVNDCLKRIDANHEYIVHVPDSYFGGSKPVPLALDLVGNEIDPNHERKTSGELEQSDQRGFIAVWPKPPRAADQGGWEIDKDEAYLRRVIADIQRLYRVDPRRIYMTGHSRGGYMTHQMGCRAADVLHAIAPVSYPLAHHNDCRPTDRRNDRVAISETTFHGMDDTVVSFGDPDTDDEKPGTYDLTPEIDSLRYWAEIDGCNTGAEPDRSPVYPNDPNNDSHVRSYSGCNFDRFGERARVRLVAIRHAGHDVYDFQGKDRVDIAKFIWNRVFDD